MKNGNYEYFTKGLPQGICKAKSLIIMAVGIVFVLTPGIARAAYLYWATTQVQTTSLSLCYQFAQSAMQSSYFQNIQVKQSEVTGTSGDVYAAITCLQQTRAYATAVVMVVGENDGETSAQRDNLTTKISQMTPLFL
ncbi:MAG: hypothetical protein ACYT04_32460 [Nostoc sp.]